MFAESRSRFHRTRNLVAALLALAVIGCDIPPRPPLAEVKPARSSGSVGSPSSGDLDAIGHPDIGAYPGDWETWVAYFIRGNQVGYSHVTATSSRDEVDATKEFVTYTFEDQLKVRRGKSVVVQHLTQTSTEVVDGQLEKFEAELRIGPVSNQFYGRLVQDELLVETIRGSYTTSEKVEWTPATHGLVAIEQSLRRRPMTDGEIRKFQMLMPANYRVANVVLSCSGSAAVPMMDGEPRTLTEINQRLQVGDATAAESVIWADDDGSVVKTYTPALQLTAFRTDMKTALQDAVKPEDLVTATGIEVTGKLQRPSEAKRVAFHVTPSSLVRDPKDAVAIAPAPDQYTRARPDGSYQILISRVVENVQQGFVASKPDLVDDDLKPNALVDFKTPLIKRMTDAAVSSADLVDQDIALDLARTVKQSINLNNLSHGLKKASTVAQDSEGDCNGQAILLAAMLRAKNIPSRVAAGLVYRPETEPGSNPRMVYHMWTLAYVDGRWLSLDATVGGAAPPDRITLVTSNLSGGDEYSALAPILNVLGQIEIRVLKAQY